ncbi:MAG: hypothetical protein LQ345_007269 [Seirophora villosa]|nr:MAG: hypothetical protein LQ345_007269 [Seirophora villosa]
MVLRRTLCPRAIALQPPGDNRDAILEILEDTKDQKDNFKLFDNSIKSEDITDEFLGYFFLLTSYCVFANSNQPREGLNRSLSIMPCSRFVTQYIQFVERKLEAQFCDGKTSLYDIIQQGSGRHDKLARNILLGLLGQEKTMAKGSDKPAPIFDFRELVQVTGDGLGDTVGSYENKGIEYQDQEAQHPDL